MSATDYLQIRYPLLADLLPRRRLAELPTPVQQAEVKIDGRSHRIAIKRDDLAGSLYGGNKLRKLEYLIPLAEMKQRRRIATFGAVGSNSALAVALYARQLGFDCTCFLMHQAKTPWVPATLNLHVRNGTELVHYGGGYASRIRILRKHLSRRDAWVIPMGCSSWRGTVGFIAAGLELADQVAAGEAMKPDRVYVGTGTMGTAAGLAAGFALAGLDTEVHAVRVSEPFITNDAALRKLAGKTLSMLHRIDASLPTGIEGRLKIQLRHEFFGEGYAHTTPAADEAIAFAAAQLDLALESTYTGKTLAAVLADLSHAGDTAPNVLFWNTYCPLPDAVPDDRPLDPDALPAPFLKYFA